MVPISENLVAADVRSGVGMRELASWTTAGGSQAAAVRDRPSCPMPRASHRQGAVIASATSVSTPGHER
jgi:hypothetical protein